MSDCSENNEPLKVLTADFLAEIMNPVVDSNCGEFYYVSEYGNSETMKPLGKKQAVLQKIFQMQCEICKALAHPQRLAIVDRLNAGETSASDLIADLRISKANLSKHISLLVRNGIVESRRHGRQLFYMLTDPEIHKACSIMRSILYRRLKEGEKLASAIHTVERG